MTILDDLCEKPFYELADAARARVLSRLADTELYVALTHEPVDDQIELRMFDLEAGRTALATDTEYRLAAFLGGPVPYIALPGRVLAEMLAAEQVALMVNPQDASSMILPPDLLAWLHQGLSGRPVEAQSRPLALTGPDPQAVAILAEALALRLGDMAGLTQGAALVGAQWKGGETGHLIVLEGVTPDHQPALAKAVADLLAFLPEIEGGVDITFDPIPLPDAALRLVLEKPEPQAPLGAPGMDPSRPPNLR